jgi:dihydrofolate reductase
MKNKTDRKLIVSMTMTLNGYVTSPNNSMDWLNGSDDVWTEMFKDLASVDTYLLGGNMSQEYADYWHSRLDDPSDPNMQKYARIAHSVPHIVFSHSIKKFDYPNYRVATDAKAEIAKLKQEPGKNILVWGGASFVNYLVKENLVDEFRLTISPTLMENGGKTILHDIKERGKLSMIDTRPLSRGNVILRYSVD